MSLCPFLLMFFCFCFACFVQICPNKLKSISPIIDYKSARAQGECRSDQSSNDRTGTRGTLARAVRVCNFIAACTYKLTMCKP